MSDLKSSPARNTQYPEGDDVARIAALEEASSILLDASESSQPRRISTLPPLPGPEEQTQFLRSAEAVVESLGLRIPAQVVARLRHVPLEPKTERAPVEDKPKKPQKPANARRRRSRLAAEKKARAAKDPSEAG